MASVPSPMLATAGRPPDQPGRWAIEMKWDGIRAVIRCDGDSCRFFSRNNRDITRSYPELSSALTELAAGRRFVIDGEITAPEPGTGAPSFGRLQRRMHVLNPSPALQREVPVEYFAFDLLELEGESLMSLPYQERRDRLAALDLEGPGVRTSPYWVDVDVPTMVALAHEHHLEGIVSKLLTSTYRPGTRSPAWIKTPFRHTTEAIVAGWLPGSGRFSTTFGSLILGAYDDAGRLVHIGNVGTGWTLPARRALQTDLDRIARSDSPFDIDPPAVVARTAHWVDPTIVADVEYREASPEGLRHPSWRGIRIDKSPREVKTPLTRA
ncbi:ATP-dependent DNA ligase [Nocardia goodfellowii]|uniref:DNA ligase (ATP) n=1 Tax=Nocardia goodfellowii TaxID=882446 RepID=A0ABS4QLP1_9NOCA|nr:bifunctional non-homologous end joining protein LigD [Nocardia goodfellowii]